MSSAPPVTDARRVTAVVGVLALAVFMSSLDLFIVNLAFPYISRQYPGTSLSSLSWVLNAYTIVFAAVLVPAGRWADRIGRRRVFAAGLAGFSAGSVLCGLAPGVDLLIAARVVQAVGAGAMVPASLSLLLAAVPAQGRAKALGTWSALGALGAALGPVIGGSLVQVNWRWVFWINVPVGVAAVVLAVRVVPESRDPASRGRPDLLGALLLAAAVGLVAFALVEAPELGLGLGRLPRPAGRVGGLRRGHGAALAAAPLAGHRAGAAALADVQRRVRAPRSCTTRGSARSCSARSSSSPACGTTPRWTPGWPSRPGRSWCCRSPGWSRRGWRPSWAGRGGSR